MKRKKKYKSVITKRIWKAARKLGTAVLALVIFSSFMAMRGTNSGFSDEEKSENNTFTATSLDARVSYMELFNVTGMTPENHPDENMTFKNVGSLDFKYAIKYKNSGGDSELCDALLLTAKRNGTVVYNKSLLKDFNLADFSGNPFSIAVSGDDSWNFKIELPTDAGKSLESKTCQWNFDFSAWQTDFADNTQGFTDEETEGTNIVRTGDWLNAGDVVINEIMWMGSTASTADEWIELRNTTGSAIPIAGWKIENASSDTGGTLIIPSGSIPANGYFLIANYSKTDSAMNVDPDWVTTKLELNNSGNGNLNLKTATGVVIDSALGTPDWPAGCNDKSGVCAGRRQSMERKDNPVPGDGLLDTSWHPCISGAANDGIYWDTADGNNFGTPKAANLSPVVLNEIMFNPSDGDKEWVELYNISGEDIDVSGWYFKNKDGDKIVISKENGDNNKSLDDEGETKVPSKGRLVVYFENEYLGNEKDEVSLYNDMGTPDDEKDDVREDAFKYETTTKDEGDSFMRLPDGVGIWIDPQASPGEENKLAANELDGFRLLTYEKCFDGEKLKKDSGEEICAPAFLQYLEMIKELDDKNIKDSTLIDILGMKKADEEKKLAALLEETAALTGEEIPATDVTVEGSDTTKTAGDQTASKEETPPADVPASGEAGANESGSTPLEVVPPEEPVQPLPTPSAAEEIPKETKASDAPPADVQKETSLEPETLTTTL